MLDQRRASAVYAWAVIACVTVAGCAQPERTPGSETAAPDSARTSIPPSTAPVPPAEPETAAGSPQRGRISLYGNAFAGKRTASGDVFDPERLTMAHRTLPFGTRVRVTNLENQRSVEVMVNDRGPFVAGRIADLSAGAARQIGMVADGVVEAVLEVLQSTRAR